MKKLSIVILLVITPLCFSISSSQTHESDQAAVKKEIIKAPLGVPAGLPFSTAVKFGNFMFLSGILGTDQTQELASKPNKNGAGQPPAKENWSALKTAGYPTSSAFL